MINVGIAGFAESVNAAGGSAVPVDWRPPGAGDPAVARSLAQLVNRPEVEEANAVAFQRYLDAQPVLEGIGPAGEAVPGLTGRTLFHAGPPIGWRDMCGPMRGAVIGAILLEGWADSPDAAERMAADGKVGFAPNHEHQAVAPMAGVISPSMPVWIVTEAARGGRAFCNLNEGLGRVLRMGANGPNVLKRLTWMRDRLAPTLGAALAESGPLELKPLMAQALHMGDEVHNRNVAASALLLKRWVPALLRAELPSGAAAEVVEFMAGNDHFFLNLSMAACKAIMDAADGIEHSSLVTAMARNGVEFGIRVSGGPTTVVYRAGSDRRRFVLSGLFQGRRRGRPGRQFHRGNGRRGWVRHGHRTGDRPVRGWQRRRRHGIYPGNGPHHDGPQSGLDAAHDGIRRNARRDRRPQSGRHEHRADHQHRDRPSGGRSRAGRGGDHAGTALLSGAGRRPS
ncbi:MAG: DUF1116 domain-containing protein, partial [Kiloniellales bacterium]